MFLESRQRTTERGCSRALAYVTAGLLGTLATSVGAQSPTGPPPDVVKVPAGINRGGSSFYDGFGKSDSGWAFIEFSRWNHLTSIKDNEGRSSRAVSQPRIDAFSSLFHFLYFPSPYVSARGAVAFEVLLPIVGLDTGFNPSGQVLHNHGWTIGDLTFGVGYQSQPVPFSGLKVFSWRVGLDFIAPIGGFDSRMDLNQSSGFWSITPYLATTLLPVPPWEVSARVTYDYNFTTTRGSNAQSIPGFTFRNGQAGQALGLNFASSFGISGKLRPGINGYWLQQVTDDQTNGCGVPRSRVKELYLGPGVSWQLNRKNVLNLNIYLPMNVKNMPAGFQVNVQTIVQF